MYPSRPLGVGVADGVFMGGTLVIALCAFGHRKGFLYEWPLGNTVFKLWFGLVWLRVTFHLTDIYFKLGEMCTL